MNELTICIQLLVSMVLGGAIGIIRERDKKAAGLRTHILVSVGSTLLMQLSVYMAFKYTGSDAGRIAAQVVTGIGFIGAGTIMQDKGLIRGLTTAASIWVASAIGLAVGCGFYLGAIFATLISLVAIELFRDIEKKYIRKDGQEN
ncbi:MAG: MgtC/SapB family protein [Candidatus Saganbacteria bacterium]|nr:MgtC/SapB family protein [Candidatus Saganbacteria bacterium]